MKYLKVLTAFLTVLLSFNVSAQHKITIPKGIEKELMRIVESAVDSSEMGTPQIFTIHLTISPNGSVESVYLSEMVNPRVTSMISNAAKRAKINWKQFLQQNNITTRVQFVIPVLYFVEFDGERTIKVDEFISKFQNAFGFKSNGILDKSQVTVLMKPFVHTSAIVH
ncbi:MAG TPA: hypothetical protein VM802_20170 [Chitinophaga sp.]|uniref:hypothetical protein n=1 Tax=Chitinophaga sp. TaxID=1869181 RepID=UPI002C32BC2D|nr:hypothetical protein [Chitinophaga sp.]HVI47205.1 hypothetical protein [Chitinophaga sp.]